MTKQFGAIPFVREDGETKVVLVTSAGGLWIFPKGRHEKELGKLATARAEALEEAGVEGRLFKQNSFKSKVMVKSGEKVRLTLYPMEVQTIHAEWQEDDRRKRVFATIEEAEKLISSKGLKACLEKFRRDFLR